MNARRRPRPWLTLLGIAVGFLLFAVLQGCESHTITRRIIVSGASDVASNPEAASCVRQCLALHAADRARAACLDACPGSWTNGEEVCETAPPGSGCYLLTTTKLRIGDDFAKALAKGIAVGIATGIAGSVSSGFQASTGGNRHDDDDECDSESSSGGSQHRRPADPKLKSKPKTPSRD